MAWRPSQAKWMLALLLHAIAAASLLRLEVGAELRERFLPDDPAVQALERESERFGADAAMAVLVESDERLEARELAAQLPQWRRQIEAIPGVARVRTLFDVPTIVWDDEKTPRIVPLGATADAALALEHPLVRKLFLRRDGRGTALFVEIAADISARPSAVARLDESLQTWAARQSGYRITTAGPLAFQAVVMQAAWRDLWLVGVPLVTAVLLSLSWGLGSVRAALAVVAVALLCPIGTFGTAALLGWRVSAFSLMVVPLVFTLALLDNVHIAYAYSSRRASSSSRTDAASEALRSVLQPCVWTSATTAAGFCALLASEIPQVRQFGGLSAIGSSWAAVSSFLLLPPLLAAAVPNAKPRLERLALRVGTGLPPLAVLVTTAIVVAVSAAGLGRLQVVPEFPRLFGSNHPRTLELERLEREWGGIASVSYLVRRKELSVPSPAAEAALQEDIERMASFASLLASRELVTAVYSPFDLLSVAESEYGRRFGHRMPRDTRDELARPWIGTRALNEREREALGGWVDDKGFRMRAAVRMMQPELFPALARDLEGFRHDLSDRFDVELSGWPLAFKNLERRLLEELLMSFALSLTIVGALLLIALRSVRWWLLALVPNLLPLVVLLGMIGHSGLGFGSGLLVAPAVALGLIVDDTIHFVLALRSERSRTTVDEEALEAALVSTGSPITLTSIVLFLGFAVRGLSEFRLFWHEAAVMSAVIALAWAADVIVLPALLRMGVLRRNA